MCALFFFNPRISHHSRHRYRRPRVAKVEAKGLAKSMSSDAPSHHDHVVAPASLACGPAHSEIQNRCRDPGLRWLHWRRGHLAMAHIFLCRRRSGVRNPCHISHSVLLFLVFELPRMSKNNDLRSYGQNNRVSLSHTRKTRDNEPTEDMTVCALRIQIVGPSKWLVAEPAKLEYL